MSDIGTMLYESLEQAIVDLHGLEPGTLEYKNQAESIKVLNEMIRERERSADEYDETHAKKTFREKLGEANWPEILCRYLLPAGVSIFEVLAILYNEKGGNFITTKALSFMQKPNLPR